MDLLFRYDGLGAEFAIARVHILGGSEATLLSGDLLSESGNLCFHRAYALLRRLCFDPRDEVLLPEFAFQARAAFLQSSNRGGLSLHRFAGGPLHRHHK